MLLTMAWTNYRSSRIIGFNMGVHALNSALVIAVGRLFFEWAVASLGRWAYFRSTSDK